MRIGNLAGRAVIVHGDSALDVAEASTGIYGPDPQSVFDRWDDFRTWAAQVSANDAQPFDPKQLLAPSPEPRQIFAIGLNYVDHVQESGQGIPDDITVFTKFASSVSGPYTTIGLPIGSVDWEVELVAVIARQARQVPAAEAWNYVAGVTVGQDLSERQMQMRGSIPQFSLAKSFAGFCPTGPYLVTTDELDNPDDLQLGCALNGVPVQSSSSSNLVFSIPEIISRLSNVVTLFPGDIVFTGTPAGVGFSRDPQVFLADGDVLTSYVAGVGQMVQTFVADETQASPTGNDPRHPTTRNKGDEEERIPE